MLRVTIHLSSRTFAITPMIYYHYYFFRMYTTTLLTPKHFENFLMLVMELLLESTMKLIPRLSYYILCRDKLRQEIITADFKQNSHSHHNYRRIKLSQKIAENKRVEAQQQQE